jgi:long-chain acyl-CoA synthetase
LEQAKLLPTVRKIKHRPRVVDKLSLPHIREGFPSNHAHLVPDSAFALFCFVRQMTIIKLILAKSERRGLFVLKPHNLVEMLALAVKQHPDQTALRHHGQALTYQKCWNTVRDIAFGLERLGVRQGTKVALIAENHPRWILCDFAIMSLGGITVPMPPEASEQEWNEWLEQTEAEVVIIGSTHAPKGLTHPPQNVRHIIQLTENPPALQKALRFDTLIHLGQTIALEELDWAYPAVQPSDPATIQLVNDANGETQTIVLTHAQLLYSLDGMAYLHPQQQQDELLVHSSFAQLHARLTGYLLPLGHGATVTIADGEPIIEQLQQHQPTLLVTDSKTITQMKQQLWEHIQGAFWRKLAFNHAMRLATKYHQYRRAGRDTPIPSRWRFGYAWAHLLSFSSLHQQLGSRLRLVISGDQLAPGLHEFFGHLGVPLASLYGIAETGCPVACQYSYQSDPASYQLLPQVETRISSDGELLVKHPGMGAGWLHTGDLAAKGSGGQLHLQGRKPTSQETKPLAALSQSANK